MFTLHVQRAETGRPASHRLSPGRLQPPRAAVGWGRPQASWLWAKLDLRAYAVCAPMEVMGATRSRGRLPAGRPTLTAEELKLGEVASPTQGRRVPLSLPSVLWTKTQFLS